MPRRAQRDTREPWELIVVGNGIDAEKVLEENGRFADKWGLASVPGRRVTVRPWQGNGASHSGADGNGDGWRKEDLAPGREVVKKSADAVIARSNGEHHERSPDVGPCATEGVSACVLPSSFATSRPGVKSSARIDGAGSSELGERASISLTMIVKNEQENLPRCLATDVCDGARTRPRGCGTVVPQGGGAPAAG